jgi:alpha-L-fucosidase
MKRLLLFGILLLSGIMSADNYVAAQEIFYEQLVNISAGDSPGEIIRKAAHLIPSERQLMWQEMEFTLFIHFGMNTFTNREWGEKGTLPSLFNPTALDARQWANVAKNAGAKLLILVAKHHDGFCLWPSKYTEYSLKNSPWRDGKGDLVAEVASACREAGIKMGIYLSPWDMNSPLYGTEAYNDYFTRQLEELLTNYGTIDEVWFDGACGEGPNGIRQQYDWMAFYRTVRKLQPQAVIAVTGHDVRWVGTESGYGRESEWSVIPLPASSTKGIIGSAGEIGNRGIIFPPAGDMMEHDLGSREKILKAGTLAWYPSEVDVSIRPSWFYHAEQDSLVKTPDKLVDIWYSSVGRNSLLLLNIPPDKRGLIHENDVAALQGMKRILDETFSNDLAEKPTLTIKDSAIILDLPESILFDRVLIQEDILKGQRVEKFSLEIWSEQNWMEVFRGTTIGYKRLIRIDPVKASRIRLWITQARDHPNISAFKLFKSPAGN